MPRYTTGNGVVVDIPEETAARVGGLTPVDPPAPKPPAKRSPRAAVKDDPEPED